MLRIPLATLRALLAPLFRVVSARATLPVLAMLRVERRENCVILTGTDLDRHLEVRHALEPLPMTTLARKLAELRWAREAVAPFLVPVAELRTVLKAAKGGDIGIEPGVLSYDLAGQSLAAKLPFDAIAAKEFPPVPACKAEPQPLADATRDAILAAMPFASPEPGGQPVLHSVHLDTAEGAVVAAYGHRIFARKAALPATGAGLTVPLPAVTILALPALAEASWQISAARIQESGDRGQKDAPARWMLRFDAACPLSPDSWTLTLRSAEGNFPNWKQVVPDLADHGRAPLPPAVRHELSTLLRGLPPVNAKKPSICVAFHADRIEVRDEGSGVKASVPGQPCATPLALCVNREAFQAALEAVPGDAAVHFTEPGAPIVFADGLTTVALAPFKAGDSYDWLPVSDPAREAAEAEWKHKLVMVMGAGDDDASQAECVGIRRAGIHLRAEVKPLTGPVYAVPLSEIALAHTPAEAVA